MAKYEVFDYTPEQEDDADKYVDQGVGTYEDWRNENGIKAVGKEETPAPEIAIEGTPMSARAKTAPDGAWLSTLAPPPESINGTEYIK